MSDLGLKRILEGALFSSFAPMNIYQMKKMFGNQKVPTEGMLREALASLADDYQARANDSCQHILALFHEWLQILHNHLKCLHLEQYLFHQP